MLPLKIKLAIKNTLRSSYATFLRPIIRHRLPEKIRRALLTDLTLAQPNNSVSPNASTPGLSPFSDAPQLLLAYLKAGFSSQIDNSVTRNLSNEERDWTSGTEPLTGSALRHTLNREFSAEGSLDRQGFDLDSGVRFGFDEEFKGQVVCLTPRIVVIPFILRHLVQGHDTVLFAGQYAAILPLQVASSSQATVTVLHEGAFPYRHSRIRPVSGTLESLSSSGHLFDAVSYCFSGREPLSRYEDVVKKMLSLTKNGGRVLLAYPFGFDRGQEGTGLDGLLNRLEPFFTSRDASIASYCSQSREWRCQSYQFGRMASSEAGAHSLLLFVGTKR